MDISGLRQSYDKGKLDEADAGNDPSALFAQWFEDARALPGLEPNAMTLATADRRGRPSARVVLLKEFDGSGLVWFTNYDSRKGADLADNPQATLLFFWAPLERQVRVEHVGQRIEEPDARVDGAHQARVEVHRGADRQPGRRDSQPRSRHDQHEHREPDAGDRHDQADCRPQRCRVRDRQHQRRHEGQGARPPRRPQALVVSPVIAHRTSLTRE